jgi:hypothetical protein
MERHTDINLITTSSRSGGAAARLRGRARGEERAPGHMCEHLPARLCE